MSAHKHHGADKVVTAEIPEATPDMNVTPLIDVLYDGDGNYRGRLSANPYDAESTSNPYGRYGSRYSADSINNPYGAGSPYRIDSPNNPYGKGIGIYDGDSEGPAEADDAYDYSVPTWESPDDAADDFDAD